jgi:hypothetical protein
MMEEANWFQNLEGDIDSSHIDYLHGRLHKDVYAAGGVRGFFSLDRAPHLEVIPTDYGAYYSAKRRWDDEGNYWHRISQYIFPFHTMIAASVQDSVHLRSFVPLDDHYCMLISQQGHLKRAFTEEDRARARDSFSLAGGYLDRSSDPRSRYFTKAHKGNDYLRDYELEKTVQFCGILFAGNLQDRAMTELMCNEDGIEPIYDRSKEHLGTTDRMVIAVRRMLIAAAKKLRDQGVTPANVDNVHLDRVRSVSAILPKDADWQAETEGARRGGELVPVMYVTPS